MLCFDRQKHFMFLLSDFFFAVYHDDRKILHELLAAVHLIATGVTNSIFFTAFLLEQMQIEVK